MKFIGRQRKLNKLTTALNSSQSEMITVYGRRRVGKTHLIKYTYENELRFEITGIQSAYMKDTRSKIPSINSY